MPRTWQLTPQKFIFSQLWRPEVCTGGPATPPTPSGCCLVSLACRHVTPVSAPHLRITSSTCLLVSHEDTHYWF